MTERQKKLIQDYGPRFVMRCSSIQTDFLHLSADAVSVLTDEEWKECAESIDKVVSELQKVSDIVKCRMKDIKVPVE